MTNTQEELNCGKAESFPDINAQWGIKNEPETSFSDFINIYQQQVHILNCVWQDSERSLNSTYKIANKSCILSFIEIIEKQNITLVFMLVENNKENSVNCTFVQILITADSGICSENVSGTS